MLFGTPARHCLASCVVSIFSKKIGSGTLLKGEQLSLKGEQLCLKGKQLPCVSPFKESCFPFKETWKGAPFKETTLKGPLLSRKRTSFSCCSSPSKRGMSGPCKLPVACCCCTPRDRILSTQTFFGTHLTWLLLHKRFPATPLHLILTTFTFTVFGSGRRRRAAGCCLPASTEASGSPWGRRVSGPERTTRGG